MQYVSVSSYFVEPTLWSPFHRFHSCSSSCFGCLPPVGWDCSKVCVGFLLGETISCILVGGAWSCSSGGQGHVRGCIFQCFSMTLGTLSLMGGVCVLILLFVWAGAYSIGASRQFSGSGSWCQDADLWESSHHWYYLGLGILWQSGGQTLSSHHRSPGFLTPVREPRPCKLHVMTKNKK